MFVFHQLLYIHGAQQQLPAINRYQSRNSGLVVAHARSLHTSTLPATNFFTASCLHPLACAIEGQASKITDEEYCPNLPHWPSRAYAIPAKDHHAITWPTSDRSERS